MARYALQDFQTLIRDLEQAADVKPKKGVRVNGIREYHPASYARGYQAAVDEMTARLQAILNRPLSH